jgi:predicted negative regulator of RcsB-dependent stress response
MASALDLQEQEQLDNLKAFWNQYGNLITWTLLTLALLAGFAGWNGWNWYQRDQGQPRPARSTRTGAGGRGAASRQGRAIASAR